MMMTATEAAEYTNYRTESRFRNAVERGIMPAALDPSARPQMWSKIQIDRAMAGETTTLKGHDPIMDSINAATA